MQSRLRTAALLGMGALAVHQLRYLIAHGDGAGAALAREGHAYLGALAPAVAMLAGVAALDFLLALAVRRRGNTGSYRWVAVTACLMAVYVGQESIEGLLAAGHPVGLAAVLGNGGWVALPLACAIGLGITLLLRGADLVLAAAGRRPQPPARRAPGARHSSPPVLWVSAPLARNLAGRGPPHPLLD